MNHSSDENRVGSPGTGDAGSGGGAPLSPTFHCAACTVTRCPLDVVAPGTRTATCARPGITPGKRTLTRTSYVPALPVKKVSGLPTWAETKATQSAETESANTTEKNL